MRACAILLASLAALTLDWSGTFTWRPAVSSQFAGEHRLILIQVNNFSESYGAQSPRTGLAEVSVSAIKALLD
jgi:hypothetical protein